MLAPKQTFALGAAAMLLLGLIPLVARAVRTACRATSPFTIITVNPI
jgi:hypothetical protein